MEEPSPRSALINRLEADYGKAKKLPGGQSLFEFGGGAFRVYYRYSKMHPGQRTFYGLRSVDLRQIEGRRGFICFVTDGSEPIFLPYDEFEDVFQSAPLASDGQYKVQIQQRPEGISLYIPRAGRFSVDAFIGFEYLTRRALSGSIDLPDFTHSDVQRILADIGTVKGYSIWIPAADRAKVMRMGSSSRWLKTLPPAFDKVESIVSEVDVLWVDDRNRIDALFEVEHSTTIYSGLLRFNDILLTDPHLTRFTVVSNERRRNLFSRQLFRPTFTRSGLAELAAFLHYGDVYDWHLRLMSTKNAAGTRN